MQEGADIFLRLIKHPLKSRLFLLSKLPSAYFAGLKIRETDREKSVVSIPYKWFSRNPFRSTYFACLSMAAEMSTGVLAMLHTYHQAPSVSMLVTKVESEYFRRATGITFFSCEDGLKLKSVIDEAILSGEAKSCIARSVGVNEKGEVVAVFLITWSFRKRAFK